MEMVMGISLSVNSDRSRSRSSSAFSLVSLLVLLSLSSLSLVPVPCYSKSDEVRALMEFKKGIHSDPLGKVSGSWNATAIATASDLDSCPASFHGVLCDDSSNSVVALVLDSLNLSGELKFSTLIGLTMLRNLSLKGNNFTGRLVPQLGSMTNLQYLDLSANSFIGRIPDRIHDLWNLNYLNLSHNRFSGGYPSGIGNLQQLRVLDLHANQLWGDVRLFFSELRNAEFVDLSFNNFSGQLPDDPLHVSSLGNTIRHLNLSGNLLGGTFLSQQTLPLFQSLVVLDVGDNMIGGQLPSLFHSFFNLRVLRLQNNHLYGEIPPELLTTSLQLMELDLSGNGFSGLIRGVNSTTLEVLNLSSNRLTGSFPDFSSQSGLSLTTLRISNNSFGGTLPSQWSRFSRLSKVDLSINNLTGPIPPALFSLNLIDLNLSKNHFHGPIPFPESMVGELLAQPVFAPLESLDLSENLLEGELSSDIGYLGRLRSLNLAKNSLAGHIPASLVNIDGLESLDLSSNRFDGHLPDKLPSGLKALNLTYNNLSGTVPRSLRIFPPTSFHPGNEKLLIPDYQGSPIGSSSSISDGASHRGSKSSIRVAIILASVGAALMIGFVALAYYRAQFRGGSKLNAATTGRDVKLGRLTRPSLFKFHAASEPSETSLSFSNTHLLTSNSRSLSGQAEVVTDFAERVPVAATSSTSYMKPNLPDNLLVTSARKSPPGSPLSSSPRVFETSEQPITLDVYSPDRFAGELYFLDASLAFTAEQLSRAPAEVLGRSNHGTLYKATLNGGQMLTVKWLRVGLVKNKKDFAKEVKKIGSMRHPNIVPVRAYYWGPREQERLILSDYVDGDSLALHLYGMCESLNALELVALICYIIILTSELHFLKSASIVPFFLVFFFF